VNAELKQAYAHCRAVARRAARNFYYAFLALPRRKRDALSAVYAFMRRADDISDDPALSVAERRRQLEAWRAETRRALAGEGASDPVLLALGDAQRAFHIPPALFDQLLDGTAMDLEQGTAAGEHPAVLYRDFEELSHYCYHVASVVGLVCIRVFGYSDPRAEQLAERVGIAFQLTNIIRDVREDAALGRVYLPAEDLARFGRSAAELRNGAAAAAFRPVLALEAERAREHYAAADELLPLIEADSRPALWVLVEIYRRLLERMAERDFDVFQERVGLSSAEKLSVLGRGMLRRLA
jgi:phytoene synthase